MGSNRFWQTALPHKGTGHKDYIHYGSDDNGAYLLIKRMMDVPEGPSWSTVYDSRVALIHSGVQTFDPDDPFFTFQAQLFELGYPPATFLELLLTRKDPEKHKWMEVGAFEYVHYRAVLEACDDNEEFRVHLWHGNYSNVLAPSEATTIGSFHTIGHARTAFEYAIKSMLHHITHTDVAQFVQVNNNYK